MTEQLVPGTHVGIIVEDHPMSGYAGVIEKEERGGWFQVRFLGSPIHARLHMSCLDTQFCPCSLCRGARQRKERTYYGQ